MTEPVRVALARTGLDAVPDPMFDRFAEMVRTTLGVPVALVSLVGDDRQFFPGACGLGQPWQSRRQTPLSHSFCEHVVAGAQPLVVSDARDDPRVQGNLAIEDLGVVGYAGMPLTDADGHVLGSLCAIDHEPRQWTEQQLRLLRDLAAACSDSLRLRIANDRTGQELQRTRAAAETLQRALLTPLPELGHVRMAARYVPAHQHDLVGGDWYDAVRIDDDRLVVVIGDVAGHGVEAAATMGQYRNMVRMLLADRYDYPSALLDRFERGVRLLGVTGMATAVIAYLTADPAGGHTLTWANAGHIPPTLVCPDGGISLLAGGDPLLGAFRGVARRTRTRHLPAGSTLLLHTDGLIETRTRPIDDGLAKLHRVLARHRSAAPDELADVLMGHTDAPEREDDACLLLIRTGRRPAG